MKYLYYAHGEILNSYISLINNTLIKKFKEKYNAKVYFNFVPENGIAKYIIKVEMNIENKDKLLQIQDDIRYDEIRIGIIYRRWSKSSQK